MALIDTKDFDHVINRMADERAAKLKTLAKATVVLCTTPEWVRAEEANALFGLPINQIYDYAKAGKLTAKKTDRMNRNSAVIFKTEDIRRVIDGLEDYQDWAKNRPDLKGVA